MIIHKYYFLLFYIELCQKPFSQSHHLKTHIRSVHEGVRKHKCDYCSRAFSQSSNLKTHIKRVHKIVDKLKCDHCEKKFVQESHLKSHITRIHLGLFDDPLKAWKKGKKSYFHFSGTLFKVSVVIEIQKRVLLGGLIKVINLHSRKWQYYLEFIVVVARHVSIF